MFENDFFNICLPGLKISLLAHNHGFKFLKVIHCNPKPVSAKPQHIRSAPLLLEGFVPSVFFHYRHFVGFGARLSDFIVCLST